MAACTSGIYEYLLISLGAGTYEVHAWDKNLKTNTVEIRTFTPGSDYFPLADGAIVDVRERQINGVWRVQLVQIDYSQTTTGYIRFIDLVSTSGDSNNRLLFGTRSGTTLTVKMYALQAKEETTTIFALQSSVVAPVAGYPTDGYVFTPGTYTNTPCLTSKLYTWSVSYCDGYVRRTTNASSGTLTNTTEVNSPTCGYTHPVTGGYDISERLRFRAISECPKNPVYIAWINTLGGIDYWLFERKQNITMDITSEGTYQENYTTLADTYGPEKQLKKQAQERMIVITENISASDREALKELYLSNKVFIIDASLNPLKEIIIAPGSFLVSDTSINSSSLQFEILLPKINTIGN